MNENTIDGDALARASLNEIKDARDRMRPGSPLRQSFNDVLREVAVRLIAGDVPAGMDSNESTRRGRDLLALLQDNAI